MTTVNDLLELDGNLIMLMGLAKLADRPIGEQTAYSGICGGYIEGVYQWASHNDIWWSEVSNKKYIGYVVNIGGAESKLYIPSWVLKIETNNWAKAKNLFLKYLKKKN